MSDESSVGTPSPAEATPSAPAPTPSATPSATPQAVAPATPTATPQTPQVDPSWLRQRLEETRNSAVRAAQQQFSQQEQQYRARQEQLERQLQALVGVNPKNPQDSEAEAIRAQFSKLYPGLNELESLKDQIKAVLNQQQDTTQQIQHYWTTYGRQTMDSLYSKASEAYGGNLSDAAKRQLYTAFVGYVQSSPDIEARYGNDPSLVDEFWKDFTSSFVDPIRRGQQAAVVGRVPQALPQDTPGGAPRATPAPQMKDMDERSAAGWAMFQNLKGR